MTAGRTVERYAVLVSWAATGLFFAVATFVAVIIPYHASDALTFGQWSRLIGEHGDFRFASTSPQAYGRPLFYVLQGWLWWVAGFAETYGRLLSEVFSLVLLVSLVWIARSRPWGRGAAALVALALVATPSFAMNVASGLTDVPVAALVAATGAFVWAERPAAPRSAGAAVTAACAVLAKPSALPALLGLAVAQLVAGGTWRTRLTRRLTPIVVGIAVGLAYDASQARHAHQSLRAFLQAGVNTPYYRSLAAASRRPAGLDVGWLGDGLRVALMFAVVYALLRLLRVAHRDAVLASVGLAAIGCWVLPWLGIGESHLAVGSLHSGGAAAAAVGSLAFLAVGAWGFADAVPATLELAQLLVWALPSLVGWLVYATYDPRLLAPAWPPLLLLVALTALPALSGFARRGAVAAAVPLALFAVVVADNVYNVDGLGRSGWDELRRTPASKWFDRTTMRALVLPGLTHALTAARPQMRSQDRLLSPEGAFAFYFPGRVEQSFPNGCGYLSPFRVFVLTTDEGSKRYMENFLGVSGEPSYWASCTNPRLTQLTDGSDGYAVFRVNG